MNLNKKKSVFFDLGNVVIFFCHQTMCKQLADISHASIDEIKEALIVSPLQDLYERGAISSEDVYNHFKKVFPITATFKEFSFALSDIFSLNEEIIPLLHELKNNNIELILLSNTCKEHFEFAKKKFSEISLFDEYVLSYEAKARKPEKEIFEIALSKSSSEISNCFYTDDIEQYTSAASALGIASHTFTSAHNLRKALFERGFLNET